MKKLLPCMITIMLIMAMSLAAVNANAGWELYDDFNSGIIDPQLWDIGNASANITIDNGRVRFEHLPGYAGISSWLRCIERPEEIKGISATVEVASCTGDVRGRVCAHVGKLGDDDAYHQIAIQPSIETIWGDITIPSHYRKFYAHFKQPIDVIQNAFTMTIIFIDEKRFIFEADGLGKASFMLSESLLPPDSYVWRAYISTRSTNGDGPCVVYFDDVYVLRKDGLCESDFDDDGDVDGTDLAAFAADFGRTDCP